MSRSPASARVHPTASRTIAGRSPRGGPALRDDDPWREAGALLEGHRDEILAKPRPMDEDRHPGLRGELGEPGDRLERHLPRFRHEHRGGTRLHGERRGIPPPCRAVDDDDRPGRAIDALRAQRKAGDGDDVVGQLGDDGDAGVHDGAPAWIAAAAASARSIAKIASSRTSWYSMVAVPSRSAASARHSRT